LKSESVTFRVRMAVSDHCLKSFLEGSPAGRSQALLRSIVTFMQTVFVLLVQTGEGLFALVTVVGFHHSLDDGVAHHVAGIEVTEADAVDAFQYLAHMHQAGAGALGQVDLGDITGDYGGGA